MSSGHHAVEIATPADRMRHRGFSAASTSCQSYLALITPADQMAEHPVAARSRSSTPGLSRPRRVERSLDRGLNRQLFGRSREPEPARLRPTDAVLRGDGTAVVDHQAQDGVVHALVLGRRTGHVDVQVAERQVAEDEDASVSVHARDRGFRAPPRTRPGSRAAARRRACAGCRRTRWPRSRPRAAPTAGAVPGRPRQRRRRASRASTEARRRGRPASAGSKPSQGEAPDPTRRTGRADRRARRPARGRPRRPARPPPAPEGAPGHGPWRQPRPRRRRAQRAPLPAPAGPGPVAGEPR